VKQTVLYRTVERYFPQFLAQTQQLGTLPKFVQREFEDYLKCGLLEHGWALCHCTRCGLEHRVGLSCKRRGFCPSCVGRRMNEAATELVDEVLPAVAMRQWVVTVPWALKYRFGYDRRACALLSRLFNEALARLMRRKAKAELGLSSVSEAHTGAVTFVQRADAALRLSPHLHVLLLDGVYVRDSSGKLEFHAISAPTPDKVQWVAQQTATRVLGKLQLEEVGQDDGYHHDEPLLAHIYGSSVSGTEALGPRQGMAATRLVEARTQQAAEEASLVAQWEGFGVYADRSIDGRDRQRLFALTRYLTRPPVSQARLSQMRDGRLCYRLKRVFRDGTAAVVLSPLDLISRLAALVPPPRFHLVRYSGVLSSHASLRPEVILGGQPKRQLLLPFGDAGRGKPAPKAPSRRTSWAKMLARVFQIDVTVCPTCGGPMKIVRFVTEPEQIAQALGGAGATSRAPPQVGPTQLELPMLG